MNRSGSIFLLYKFTIHYSRYNRTPLTSDKMKFVLILLCLMLISCSHGKETTKETNDTTSQKRSTQGALIKEPRINYSKLLGHYYEYAGSDEATFNSLLDKFYYDVRFGTDFLVVKKCTKIAECGDRIDLKFRKKEEGYIVFEMVVSDDSLGPTWSFKDDFLIYKSFDQSSKEWKEFKYLAYREELGESAY